MAQLVYGEDVNRDQLARFRSVKREERNALAMMLCQGLVSSKRPCLTFYLVASLHLKSFRHHDCLHLSINSILTPTRRPLYPQKKALMYRPHILLRCERVSYGRTKVVSIDCVSDVRRSYVQLLPPNIRDTPTRRYGVLQQKEVEELGFHRHYA
ncbi:hypothetical protein EV356DRAFT_141066 [Viridothelium virens]|uniref:Uncharacterized protein n=1 Tax=Viridothelium virens TaxID=1048519 RepID=A0A6A6H9G2_VIRVR|nr:hypothetical protein EV356DRAFT_141066 [Viridothelium virens]